MPDNPFDDLIVTDPRRREPAVDGLNERPLRELLQQFDKLASGVAPRETRPASHALLVTSPQPGYGKSHLIGRLFRELSGRATLVYVLPFQNPTTVFQSLVMAVAREMHFPDHVEVGAWNPDEASKLDLLAHSVLAHLVADLVEIGRDLKTEDPAGMIASLRGDPLSALNRGAAGDVWADWLRANFEQLLPLFEEALARRGVGLNSRGWLRVLMTYAFAPFQPKVRQTCLDWLTAQPLGDDERERIGLRVADSVDPEISPEQANDICRTRVADLCQLARFFRPFVFCFDQTEIYGHHRALARSFGMVVAALVNEAGNHLTLVTSNQDPWLKRIAPHIEDADLERIARPPVVLEGLNRAQGEELVRLRSASRDLEPARADAFLSGTWLSELFPTERNQMGARHFLQKCKERWENQPSRTVPLPELYEQRRNALLASSKRRGFEPDTLAWCVEEVPQGCDGISVERLEGGRYFSVGWRTPERTCLFGFEAGESWRRWRGIARDITAKNTGDPPPIKAIFFRTPEQTPIPGPWRIAEEIEAAKATCLHIISLTQQDVAAWYAAKDLFADAAQGDIPYTATEVLAFLREELAPWWTRLRGPVEGPVSRVPGTHVLAPEDGQPAAST